MVSCLKAPNGISSKSATPSLIQYSLCLVVCALRKQCWVASALCSQLAGKPVFSECGLDRLLEMQVPLPFAPHLSSPR